MHAFLYTVFYTLLLCTPQSSMHSFLCNGMGLWVYGVVVSMFDFHIVNCTKHIIISSLNARILGPIGRLEDTQDIQGIDIVAVQEHRFYHPDDILKYHQVGSYQLVTSSASKNSSNASVGGAGFLLSSKASNNLLGVESISPRIMVLEREGNPKTTVMCL